MMLTNTDYIHIGYVSKTLRTLSTRACTKVVYALLICVFHPHSFTSRMSPVREVISSRDIDPNAVIKTICWEVLTRGDGFGLHKD